MNDVVFADGKSLLGVAEFIERDGFWAFVDSARGYVRVRDGWREERAGWDADVLADNPQWMTCIASNSRGERCAQILYQGLPFCSRHLPRVRRAFAALDAAGAESAYRRSIGAAFGRAQDEIAYVKALQHDLQQQLLALEARVYFYETSSAVKVGFSTDPAKRTKSFANGLGAQMPEGIELATGRLTATIPGGRRFEHLIHGRLRAHRLIGEWFALNDDVRAVLDEYIDLSGDSAEVFSA